MKRKIISGLLVLVLLLPLVLVTGCSSTDKESFTLPSTEDLQDYVFNESKKITRTQVKTETVTKTVKQGDLYVKVEEEEQVEYTAEYVLAQENTNYALYFNQELLDIALVNKQTGETWYSNPGPADRDPDYAKGLMSEMNSQLQIFYLNKTDSSQGFKNTYTDCIVEEQNKDEAEKANSTTKQYYVVNHDGALRVIYILGKVRKEFAVPMVIEKEVMDDLVEQLKADGRGGDASRLKSAYTIIMDKKAWDKATPDRQNQVTDLAPMAEDYIVNQDKTLCFIVDDTVKNNPTFMAQIEQIFVDYLGYDLEKRDAQNEIYGVQPDVPDVFWIPLDYKLEDDGLKVSISSDEIAYNDSIYEISTIDVLKYFGAGDRDEDGYMFVPDGSGAIINFNNGKTQIDDAVKVPVYGLDEGRERNQQPFINQQGYLPVFGIKKEKSALFAIMESGASVATVVADISGKSTTDVDKNIVYPSYKLVDFQALSTVMSTMTLRVYQEKRMMSDIEIKYTILPEEKADYSGMAEFYRNYLYEKGILEKSELPSEIPFNLELVGGCSEKTAFLGISYQKMYALTTFDQAKEIIDQLIDKGIKNISINYKGWANNGLRNSTFNKIDVLSQLGGKNGLQELMAYGAEKGVTIYPEAELLYVYKDTLFDGYNALIDTSRMINRENNEHVQYDIVTQRADLSSSKNKANLIGPTKLKITSANVLQSYKDLGLDNISLGALSTNLSSNNKLQDFWDREMVMNAYTEIAESYTDSGLHLMGKGVNSYMLGSVERIYEISNTSSNFVLADASVPFYQMVIHGAIQYSGEAINLNGDPQTVFLQAVEAGSGLYYRWAYANNDELKDIEFAGMYSLNYKSWLDQAAEMYIKYNDLLGATANVEMLRHDILATGVTRVTYADGTLVYVNYNTDDYTVDGVTIPAEDFVVKKGGTAQ